MALVRLRAEAPMTSPTPPDAQVGFPSEEIRRIVDDALNSATPEPWEVSAHATQRILDLIRPAFEAKERELQAALFASRHETDLCQQALADRAAAEAKLAQAVEALKPFADYYGEHYPDTDDKGSPLPDDAGVGWVYLTMGAFRRARSAAAMGEKT
jgi:hypothetical protein